MRWTHHALKPVTPKWLQYIIESTKFKGGNRVLVMSRGENHFRLISKLFDHLQSRRAGHHDIQEKQLRTVFVS